MIRSGLRKFLAFLMLTAGPAIAQSDNTSGKTDNVLDLPPQLAQANPQSWRAVNPENLIIFDTTKGRIIIEILDRAAPNHGQQFRTHVRSGLYDGTSFHRVIEGFMAQGGDIETLHNSPSPLADIAGEFTFKRTANEAFDPAGDSVLNATQGYIDGFPIRTEPGFMAEMLTDGKVTAYIPHCTGVVSTARTNDPNSANAQFFLMRDHSPHLDKQYTAWGIIRIGLDVALKLKKGNAAQNGSVKNPDILTRAQMAADMPPTQQPILWVMRTDSEEFKTNFLAPLNGADICDHTAVPIIIG